MLRQGGELGALTSPFKVRGVAPLAGMRRQGRKGSKKHLENRKQRSDKLETKSGMLLFIKFVAGERIW